MNPVDTPPILGEHAGNVAAMWMFERCLVTPGRVRALTVTLSAALWAAAFGFHTGASQSAPPAAQQRSDQLALQAYRIFEESCLRCHGEFGESGLDLRTEASLQKGGARGRAVIAHDPEASRLYRAVAHLDDLRMPSGDPKLADKDIEVIREWILAGASLASVPEAAPREGAAAAALAAREERPLTAEERAYWAFVTPVRPVVPAVTRAGWRENPIDRFLLSALEARGLTPSPPAEPRALVRRAYLDVLGLPPSPAEVDAFVNDQSSDAWPKLVDRLLGSPHYGERWARRWMDLVRYADSGGFEFDVDRPEMYRYRDYLVRAFNEDKPFDRFVREQLAGDEFAPGADEAMIATGFLRLGPEGGGNRLDAVDDLITTSTLTFIGMTVGCARCHNHKFDPIAQKDYYRIQAVFLPTTGVEHPLAPAPEVEANRAERGRLEALRKPLEEKKKAIEQPFHQQIVEREVARLPEYLQIAWKTPPDKRTEGQRLNVTQIEDTLSLGSLRKLVLEEHVVALMPEDVKAEHEAVKKELDAIDRQMPRRLPTARAIGERGRHPQPSYFLHRGSPDARGSPMTPGVLSIAATGGEWAFPAPPVDAKSSWRRRGFAEWIVSPDNPLTARVMVNRLWQHHFGEGIVRTPSNFGRMGEAPSHPALLDYLAVEFMERGWSLEAIHRLMLTSRAYRMSSGDVQSNLALDPENRLFWRMPRARLEAEVIRDAILAVSGTLDRTIGGPAVFPYIDPDLFEKSSRRDWLGRPDSDPSTWRRSLYVFSKRSIRYPMFETFDQPNLVNSTDRRNRTTIAPQALILMNNEMVRFQAGRFADRVRREAGSDVERQVAHAIELALGRPPDAFEAARGAAFVRGSASGLDEFCHLLFNLTEFLYRS
ncbi:MAG: DUF1553 domain-containing protein [Acidobacteriota bacterium]